MAARLILLAPALVSSLTLRDPYNESPLPPPNQRVSKEFACLGDIDNRTDAKFLSQCPACQLHGTDVPHIYMTEGTDALGSRLHEVIAGMAIAARHRMALGGVIAGRHVCQTNRGIKILRAAASFFGLEDPRLMFVPRAPWEGTAQTYPTYGSFKAAMKKYGRPGPTASIFLPAHCLACEIDARRNISQYYTPELLHGLRSKSFIWRAPLAFKTGSTSIAIHLRRGYDVVQPNESARGTSDEWYFSLIKKTLKLIAPSVDIHVFSTLEKVWKSSDFDSYRALGATVHLDLGPIETWAHFASADVLVMAKSSFSHVPALLNDKCVVYQPYMHKPLDGWVVAQASDGAPLDTTAAEKLRDCVAAVKHA